MTRVIRPAFVVIAMAAFAWLPAVPGSCNDLSDFPLEAVIFSHESTYIDVGEEGARWYMTAGFYKNESQSDGKTFAWTMQRWEMRMVLADGATRALTLYGRASLDDMPIRAVLNGIDLGEQLASKRWDSVVWPVPADTARPGLNTLEFEAAKVSSPSQDGRLLGYCFDALRLDGAQPGAAAPMPAPETLVLPYELESGAIVFAQLILAPESQLYMEAAGTPGMEIRVFAGKRPDQHPAGSLVMDAGGSAAGRFDLGCCIEDTNLSLVPKGTGTVRLLAARISATTSQRAWRSACGLAGPEIALALVLLAGMFAVVQLLPRLASGKLSPWIDVALVFGVALAVRLFYLHHYPFVDWRRFGDAWEYLHRARSLNEGRFSFLNDTGWHAWTTWVRPPGYYLFLAFVLRTFAGGLQALAECQAVLSALSSVATYGIAYPLFRRRAALLAGLFFALYAESVVSISWILTEPLYLCLLSASLAGMASVAARPARAPALVTGVLFGLTSLVRSAPFHYVPASCVLMVASFGRKKTLTAALLMLGGMAAIVAPWCVRNSFVYGTLFGIDNMATVNFLQVNPDERYVRSADLDLSTQEGFRRYYYRLKHANKDGAITRKGGVLRRGILRMAADPGRTLRHFGRNLAQYLDLYPLDYSEEYMGEKRWCRMALWKDLLDSGYLVIALLGVAGMALFARDRRTWPLTFWVLFNLVVINLFFYPDFHPGRFRFASIPVLAAFAGAACARALPSWRRNPQP